MSGVNEIRSAFLNYFRREGHEVVSSSPLVPRNDPTLMFANSGMVQFKNVFTGQEKRSYTTATTAQKCVRAGGKHNDLDNVGYTARHHTFFEMLGNFSFGDYFKERAIDLAWRLITKEYALPVSKLLVTVYSDDEDSFQLWKKIAGLPDSKIIRIPTADNFWRMGETGPCGPCSEIFYDHGEHIPGGPPGSPDQDGDRFIEIWNLVFMQYEELAGGERLPLPRPSIDTGMGLERVSAVLQGTHDNYETDMMRALIGAISEVLSVDAEGVSKASHRVIADHLRSSAFLIADGVLPSNEGRGYVLRRIMRRAMRHAQLLGASEALLWKLVPALNRQMGQAYPELLRAEALITETLRLEENRFGKTLARGLQILDDETSTLGRGAVLSGEVAFKLYDTYGFPLDLTQDALKNRDIAVDLDGFSSVMERQKAEARKSWAGTGETATEAQWFSVRDAVGATDFLGYDTEKAEGVVASLTQDQQSVGQLNAGQTGFVVLNQTPFYGESGGQVGDTGVLRSDTVSARVLDTQRKVSDLIVHLVEVTQGTLKQGDAVELIVDDDRRRAVRSNHSATHLLHEALRLTLGDHIAQKGSHVSAERLRFDFSHPKAIEADELSIIETLANDVILSNAPVVTRLMAVDDAITSGARALFGEKYGDEVRVVSMGALEANKAWSVELCGGTHVAQTGDIGLVAIVGESAVAAGVRRIEALTGSAARRYFVEAETRLHSVASLLKVAPADVVGRLEAVLEERKRFERELIDAKKKLAMGGGEAQSASREIAGIQVMARVLSGVRPNDLKSLADEAKQQMGSGIVILIGVSEDNKAGIVVGVTSDLTSRFNAVELVKIGAQVVGGKGGGGRPDLAQAGGPDAKQAAQALQAIEQAVLSGV